LFISSRKLDVVFLSTGGRQPECGKSGCLEQVQLRGDEVPPRVFLLFFPWTIPIECLHEYAHVVLLLDTDVVGTSEKYGKII
jgi:hypothetical protein